MTPNPHKRDDADGHADGHTKAVGNPDEQYEEIIEVETDLELTSPNEE